MKRLSTLFVAFMATTCLWASGFQIGYFFYEFTSENTVELDYAEDEITQAVIPNTVTYKGKTYSVTSIGTDAFYECTKLISVTIGNNVKRIGQDAFAECTALQSVIIGNGVTHIADGAFCLCDCLSSISYKGTKEQWHKIVKGKELNYDSPVRSVNCTNGVVAL